MNATIGTCTSYPAVEQALAGDCGGCHPVMKVMDMLYNLLITGNPAGTYTNGVTADSDGAPSSAFPFLLPPT